MVLDQADRLVLHKPAGWEVNTNHTGSGVTELQLSAYVQTLNPPRLHSILYGIEHNRGFLHRLDVPSSGLILVAKTYEAYYDLMLQLHVGKLLREYAAFCCGWMPPNRLAVLTRIRGSGWLCLPSTASERGKPASTWT